MKLLVDLLGGYAEEVGELTPNDRERVGHEDALGRGRGPLDERRILFDRAIHRSESSPNAQDILSRWCDRFKPETGSRAVHPYLNGGDVGLTP
ncbi:hypothetical protein CRG98_008180 [Punica granatum]|uniref:Uncharacterized protein n=1 Tax=Punica granatum TaxID=22663 RepID=A0A2I0KSH2_PUNGR|nr:hypothetical protein CRG98_008180 [Punica granatum]